MPAAGVMAVADQILVRRKFECSFTIAMGLEESSHSVGRVIGARTSKGRVFIPRGPVRAVQRVLLTNDSDGGSWVDAHGWLRVLRDG